MISQDLFNLLHTHHLIPRRTDPDLFTEHPGTASPKHSCCKLLRKGSAEPALTAPALLGLDLQFTDTSKRDNLVCSVCHSVLPAERFWSPSLLWRDWMPGPGSCSPKMKKAAVPCPLGGQGAPPLEKLDFWKSDFWCKQHNHQHTLWKANHLHSSVLRFWNCGLTVLTKGTSYVRKGVHEERCILEKALTSSSQLPWLHLINSPTLSNSQPKGLQSVILVGKNQSQK